MLKKINKILKYPSYYYFRSKTVLKNIFNKNEILKSKGINCKLVDNLLLIIDLRLFPVTFDFLTTLYYANCYREINNIKKIDILIIKSRELEKYRDPEYINSIGSDNINWRITNLLIPLTRLFVEIDSILIMDNLNINSMIESYKYKLPKKYSCRKPIGFDVDLKDKILTFKNVITISKSATDIVEKYFQDNREIVTITLRTYPYLEMRNSQIDEWIDFANSIDKNKYRVVFIPDASSWGIDSISKIENHDVFDQACWNIEIRAALYKKAKINMGVISGPIMISCLIEDVTTLVIDRTKDYPEEYLKNILSVGNIIGEPCKFYSKNCYFYSNVDDSTVIKNIFKSHE